MFNKDGNIKLPTTRYDEGQIQAFKTKVMYEKDTNKIEGVRICHVIRKEFKVEIVKNEFLAQFISPFNKITLDLNITLNFMKLAIFELDEKDKKDYK